jgi:hypothetical protein
MGRAATIYTLFRADLTRYVAHRPSILHWIWPAAQECPCGISRRPVPPCPVRPFRGYRQSSSYRE